jgi:uncharacterized membrane protein
MVRVVVMVIGVTLGVPIVVAGITGGLLAVIVGRLALEGVVLV